MVKYMANDLNIRIKAQLNEALSKKQIRESLSRIAKDLDVNVNINTSNVQGQIDRAFQGAQRAPEVKVEMDTESVRRGSDEISNAIRKYEEQFNATTVSVSKNVSQQTGDIKSLSVVMRNAREEMMHMSLSPYEGKVAGEREFRLNEKNMRIVQQTSVEKEKQLAYENQLRVAIDRQVAKEKEKKISLQEQLTLYKRQAQVNVDNIRRTHGSVISPEVNEQLDRYIDNVNSLSVEHTPRLRSEMKNLNMDFKEIGTQVDSSSSHVAGFTEQLTTALKRIPIWMIGMTAFYAPLRGIRSAIDDIIMLDTQMTQLRRVMDATPRTYNQLLTDSIALSSELGNKVEDVNNAMTEFARQGHSPEVLIGLTEVATIASNISELSTTDAMSSLTAAMNAFNIEARETIGVFDVINEVDNNFAIDSATIATAMEKSAATATTFGATLEELVGHIAAIGITTRESGQILGKIIAPHQGNLVA